MSSSIRITITPEGNTFNLVGEDTGEIDRDIFCLDALDKSPAPVTIEFGPFTGAVTYSYIRGLLAPSVAYFNGDREAFDSHYKFESTYRVAKSITPAVNMLFPRQQKLSRFRVILNKIYALFSMQERK